MRWIHWAGTTLLTSLILFGCTKTEIPPKPQQPPPTVPIETPPAEIDTPVDEKKVLEAVGNSVLRSLLPQEESNDDSEAPRYQPG